jgi:hypothetical protein
MCDMNLYDSLSASVGKIETLSRLCPLGATNQETLMVALTVLSVIHDYAHVLHSLLDDLRAKGDAP